MIMAEAGSTWTVGCGGTQAHLEGYKRPIAAGYDASPSPRYVTSTRSRRAFAARVEEITGELPVVFATADEMAEAGAADAADICLPHAYHHTAAVACLNAGIHVMVEKPVGITVKATRRIMEAAEGTDLVIAGAEQIRRCIGARALEWAINDQRMYGDPLFFTQEVFSGAPFDRTIYNFAWRALKVLGGGGQILDGGAHFADMVQHVFGPVAEVTHDAHHRPDDHRAARCPAATR